VGTGFASDRALETRVPHDLIAKSPAVWRIMRKAMAGADIEGLGYRVND
jgi:hypothetical protein